MVYGIGGFMALGFGYMVEFFVSALPAWLYGTIWHFIEEKPGIIHSVRPFYVPMKNAYSNVDIERLTEFTDSNTHLVRAIGEVVDIIKDILIDIGPLMKGGGYSLVDEMTCSVSAIILSDILVENLDSPLVRTAAGLQGLPSHISWVLPDDVSFFSITPHIIHHTGVWANDQGRIIVYATPYPPFMAVSSSNINYHAIFRGGKPLFYNLVAGLFIPSPYSTDQNQGGLNTYWAFEVMNGVVSSARLTTMNFLNLMYGWCAKPCVSVVATVAKSARPFQPLIEKILKKAKVYKIALTIARMMPMMATQICETSALYVYDVYDILSNVKGSSVRFSSILPLSSYSYLKLGGARFVMRCSIMAGDAPALYTSDRPAYEEHSFFSSMVCVLPPTLSSGFTEDDAGYPIDAFLTNANEVGVVRVFSVLSKALTFGSMSNWLKMASITNEMLSKLDDIIDSVEDSISTILELSKSACVSKSIASAAFMLISGFKGFAQSLPSLEEVMKMAINISQGKKPNFNVVGRIMSALAISTSLYLGCGSPGAVIVWFSPHLCPVMWISRTPEMCELNPVLLAKGFIKFVIGIPEAMAEYLEDSNTWYDMVIKKIKGFANKVKSKG